MFWCWHSGLSTIYAVFIISVHTSANVQNMVVSILGLNSVHSNLGQLSPARLCL